MRRLRYRGRGPLCAAAASDRNYFTHVFSVLFISESTFSDIRHPIFLKLSRRDVILVPVEVSLHRLH